MTDPFGSMFGNLFDPPGVPKPPPAKTEKGVRMVAKTIDGEKYVRLEDLCELLKINGVLPGVEAKFRRSL